MLLFTTHRSRYLLPPPYFTHPPVLPHHHPSPTPTNVATVPHRRRPPHGQDASPSHTRLDLEEGMVSRLGLRPFVIAAVTVFLCHTFARHQSSPDARSTYGCAASITAGTCSRVHRQGPVHEPVIAPTTKTLRHASLDDSLDTPTTYTTTYTTTT